MVLDFEKNYGNQKEYGKAIMKWQDAKDKAIKMQMEKDKHEK